MEGGAFAYSHLLGKTVWGHQAMAALISDGETALCYKLERCGKNDAGKIEQAAEIASSLPMAERLSYALSAEGIERLLADSFVGCVLLCCQPIHALGNGRS